MTFTRTNSSRMALKGAGLVSLVAVLVLVAWTSLARTRALRATWPGEADTFYLPPSKILKIASLGHRELLADLIHARANVYFGTQLHEKLPTKWLAQYLHAAIDLDPKFHRLYLSGAAMLVYNGQRMVPDMVLAANGILERGRTAFPFNWEIPFQLGFNLLFELPNVAEPQDARIPAWRQQGVEVLRQAALFEGVPYFIPNLVARMLTKQGSEDLAIHHLEQAYAVATNQEARTQIRNKLQALQGQRAAEDLVAREREFQAMVQDRYPGYSEAFSLVMGPKITSNGILSSPATLSKQEAQP